MSLNIADIVILAIILISGLLALQRGFFRELVALATWIAAFIIARFFGPSLEILLADTLDTPSARMALAFAILFIATMVVGALINHLLGELIRATGLTGTDRVLGMGFGIVRGAIIVVVLVALGKHLFAADEWWYSSVLITYFAGMEQWTMETGRALSDWVFDVSSHQ